MIRSFAIALLLCLLPLSAYADETLYLNFGEWAFGHGGAATYIYETQHILAWGSAALDGSGFEGYLAPKLLKHRVSFTPGLALGSIPTATGWEPYAGFQSSSDAHFGPWTMAATFASRHTGSHRLSDYGLLDLHRSYGSSTVAVAYQPIRHSGPWVHRGAIRIEQKFRHFTLKSELRRSFGSSPRWSMNTDVSIAL